MSSSDDSDESGLGSSSSDGDEGGDDGHDMEVPQAAESIGVDRGDEEGLRDQIRCLEDLVATLWQRWMEDRDRYQHAMEDLTAKRDMIVVDIDQLQRERDEVVRRTQITMDAYDQLFGPVMEACSQADRYFVVTQEDIYYRYVYERAIPEVQREPSFGAFMGRRSSRSTSRQTSSGGVMGPPRASSGQARASRDALTDRGSIG